MKDRELSTCGSSALIRDPHYLAGRSPSLRCKMEWTFEMRNRHGETSKMTTGFVDCTHDAHGGVGDHHIGAKPVLQGIILREPSTNRRG